jgi:hypothetical protein
MSKTEDMAIKYAYKGFVFFMIVKIFFGLILLAAFGYAIYYAFKQLNKAYNDDNDVLFPNMPPMPPMPPHYT